mmetsp:Transcript_2815/g.7462  ORF Transcript_2815/g.7462 Transcript_2815/m.7462 type:complete len:257 (-) Transcript_2815:1319-2089(-)
MLCSVFTANSTPSGDDGTMPQRMPELPSAPVTCKRRQSPGRFVNFPTVSFTTKEPSFSVNKANSTSAVEPSTCCCLAFMSSPGTASQGTPNTYSSPANITIDCGQPQGEAPMMHFSASLTKDCTWQTEAPRGSASSNSTQPNGLSKFCRTVCANFVFAPALPEKSETDVALPSFCILGRTQFICDFQMGKPVICTAMAFLGSTSLTQCTTPSWKSSPSWSLTLTRVLPASWAFLTSSLTFTGSLGALCPAMPPTAT